jgi:hypothetical protein
MCIEVRGQKGQDDGNKHNKGDVGHENDVTLLIGPIPVNP